MRHAAGRRRAPWRRAASAGSIVVGLALLLVAGWMVFGPGVRPVVGEHLTAVEPEPTATAAEPPAATAPTPPTDAPVRDRADLARASTRSDAPSADAAEDPVADPVAVEIPRIGVDAELIELGLDDDRRLEVPDDPDVPGWFAGGPRPGEDGPAVIAGHVDSYQGPAVFWKLPELEPGDEIVVRGEDGSTIRFAVDRLGRWPKDDFPTEEVYERASGAELRLITCGGVFDEEARSYRDNIVVFASEVP